MRLYSALIAFTAAAHLVCVNGFSTITEADEVKPILILPVHRVSNAGDNVKRSLRNVDTQEHVNDGGEEERGTKWETIKALIPGAAKRQAAKDAKEIEIIKKERQFFSDLAIRKVDSADVTDFYRSTRSEKTAKKMGRLYEKYKANPGAYL
ncbi:putative secreted RxLR effector protein [Phytophthora cinnamomi]|uniref:putative secreted RxLR effector protein n=1 Tax=Phytophthora cinnamomi TaxID=4785 RepID=UPI00355A0E52|nr:putative secreted RxLR effector protein [Phytophthora cinnamomi]